MTASICSGFRFSKNIEKFDVSGARVVRIPAGLSRQRDLLALFSKGLDFPGYFGWNWDALEECLQDLAWIDQPSRIVLIHEGLPFQPSGGNRGIYLDILRESIGVWGPDQRHELLAVFHDDEREEVCRSR